MFKLLIYFCLKIYSFVLGNAPLFVLKHYITQTLSNAMLELQVELGYQLVNYQFLFKYRSHIYAWRHEAGRDKTN